MFFITYTFFRLVPLTFLNMRVIYVTWLSVHRVNLFRKICQYICCVNACFILFINYYWYGLILKGLKRLLEEGGERGGVEPDHLPREQMRHALLRLLVELVHRKRQLLVARRDRRLE